MVGCCVDQVSSLQINAYLSYMEQKLDMPRSMKYGINPDTYKDEQLLWLLYEYYRNDRCLATLETDASQRTGATIGVALRMAMMLPCFLPHALMLGCPCSLACVLPAHVAAARAHKLALHDRAVILTVDPYDAQPYSPTIVCAAACSSNIVRAHTVTVRLVDIESCYVDEVPKPEGACLTTPVPTTLKVKLVPNPSTPVNTLDKYAGTVIVVDGPANGAEFARAVMEQKERVVSSGADNGAPPNVVKAAHYGRNAFDGMMGALMGAAMAQQQMMMANPQLAQQMAMQQQMMANPQLAQQMAMQQQMMANPQLAQQMAMQQQMMMANPQLAQQMAMQQQMMMANPAMMQGMMAQPMGYAQPMSMGMDRDIEIPFASSVVPIDGKPGGY